MIGMLFFTITYGIFIIAMYCYVAFALMKIAERTHTENPWLAWIPIANLYLMSQIAKMPWWTLLLVIPVGMIPLIGWVASVVVTALWWWKIAERRHKEGWFGLLIFVPIVNLIIVGILAWGD